MLFREVEQRCLPRPASSSMRPTLSRVFSSLYECSCRFHSSTFAVDSCSADVSRALLFFNVASSTSHFFAFAELKINGYDIKCLQEKISIDLISPLSKGQLESIVLVLELRLS